MDDSVARLGAQKAIQGEGASMSATATKAPFKSRYGNFIGGKWREAAGGKYFGIFRRSTAS
jgi:hypothetical protein